MTTSTTKTSIEKALVTGASSGIGAVYADRLARRGHDLVLVARDTARLEALATRLRAETGVSVEVLTADLSDSAQLATVEARLRDDDSIGMLINNAGVGGTGPWVGMDVEKSQTLIDVNIVAPTRLLAAVATRFARRKGGTIVNVASVLAFAPEMFSGIYSGTKAFLLNVTHSLQAELGPLGVRVQAVLPGATRTEIWARGGVDVSAFPAEMLMEVDDLVDAALYGLDRGEVVTIPPLADIGQYEAYEAARLAMAPNLSRRDVGTRYRVKSAVAA
ncbi:MAG: family oxidoreductase [Rhizobacter sp.]|nr:family oxidoreductase [Rhizobacter sp.]